MTHPPNRSVSLAELLATLASRGIVLTLDGDRVHVANARRLRLGELERLRLERDDIVALLRPRPEPEVPPVAGEPRRASWGRRRRPDLNAEPTDREMRAAAANIGMLAEFEAGTFTHAQAADLVRRTREHEASFRDAPAVRRWEFR